MLTAQEAASIRSRLAVFTAWLDHRCSYKHEEVPASLKPEVTNAERSSLEVYDFVTNPPDRYFLYIDVESGTATTWTGDVLGTVAFGKSWRSNMGDTRQSVAIFAVNQRRYTGTYYKSTGDYARVRIVK